LAREAVTISGSGRAVENMLTGFTEIRETPPVDNQWISDGYAQARIQR
jgi:hypothetical protein